MRKENQVSVLRGGRRTMLWDKQCGGHGYTWAGEPGASLCVSCGDLLFETVECVAGTAETVFSLCMNKSVPLPHQVYRVRPTNF